MASQEDIMRYIDTQNKFRFKNSKIYYPVDYYTGNSEIRDKYIYEYAQSLWCKAVVLGTPTSQRTLPLVTWFSELAHSTC